jgi:hypothetical protein
LDVDPVYHASCSHPFLLGSEEPAVKAGRKIFLIPKRKNIGIIRMEQAFPKVQPAKWEH